MPQGITQLIIRPFHKLPSCSCWSTPRTTKYHTFTISSFAIHQSTKVPSSYAYSPFNFFSTSGTLSITHTSTTKSISISWILSICQHTILYSTMRGVPTSQSSPNYTLSKSYHKSITQSKSLYPSRSSWWSHEHPLTITYTQLLEAISRYNFDQHIYKTPTQRMNHRKLSGYIDLMNMLHRYGCPYSGCMSTLLLQPCSSGPSKLW